MPEMNIGMLWGRETPSLADDIVRAAKFYLKKYGLSATCFHVNPADLPAGGDAIIHVKADKSIQRGTIWVGSEKEQAQDVP